jgi:hypothetical protein
MKQFILIALVATLAGCFPDPREIYETEIKSYVISHKQLVDGYRGPDTYYLYFQTPTSTESARVSESTYNNYQVGDKISVLIKYWEKPKKK